MAEAKAWRVVHHANRLRAPRASGLPPHMPLTLADFERANARVSSWPEYEPTPLRSCPDLAEALGIEALYLKDETNRFGSIGSFKALGGRFAVEELLSRTTSASPCVATASAGNHGIGLAWSCAQLGVPCHVFLSTAVPEAMAARIRSLGAAVHRVPGTYEASLAAAQKAADESGWAVVQDVDWPGYVDVPRDIWSGYMVLAEEMRTQAPDPPTHVLVNAGVGGLASAVCAHMWARCGAARPRFITTEPRAADCLLHSAVVGRAASLPDDRIATETTRQVGLDCKAPAPLAWEVLSEGVDDFVAVDDEVIEPCVRLLAEALDPPMHAGDSAVAGLGALLASAAQPELGRALNLDASSRVAIIICEGDHTSAPAHG